jgi:hypothetical protein
VFELGVHPHPELLHVESVPVDADCVAEAGGRANRTIRYATTTVTARLARTSTDSSRLLGVGGESLVRVLRVS